MFRREGNRRILTIYSCEVPYKYRFDFPGRSKHRVRLRSVENGQHFSGKPNLVVYILLSLVPYEGNVSVLL